jgi:competence protein ComEA
MWRQFIRDYFIFTRKERAGIIFILSIIFFLMLLSFAFPFLVNQQQYSHAQFEKEIALLDIKTADSSTIKSYSKNFDKGEYNNFPADKKNDEIIKPAVFYFDPNTISPEDWRRLGVRDKTITTIQKYLSKGGKFRSAEDISKIWGLSTKDKERLIPYVSIKAIPSETTSYDKKEYPKSFSYPAKAKQLIDVNLADTTGYISLPGIGSRLSQRIIAFRDKLGGFHSINQVGETYLLPDSTFQKIKPRLVIGDTIVKKININIASIDEMKAHPYLRYALANAIFQYRTQHGNYGSVEAIKKIMLVNDEVFNKIAPYLSVK